MASRYDGLSVAALKRRRVWCHVLGFLATILPVCAMVVWRWDVYTYDGGGIKLGAGGILLAVVVLLGFLGRLKGVKREIGLMVSLVLVWLLSAILTDLLLLLSASFAGVILDDVFFAWRARRLTRAIDMKEQAGMSAEATTAAVAGLLRQYLGGK